MLAEAGDEYGNYFSRDQELRRFLIADEMKLRLKDWVKEDAQDGVSQ